MGFKRCIDILVEKIGIKSMGQAGFSLMVVLLKISSENGWDPEIIIGNDRLQMLTGIGSDPTLWRNRNTLTALNLISYEINPVKASEPGTYTIMFESLGIDVEKLKNAKGKNEKHNGNGGEFVIQEIAAPIPKDKKTTEEIHVHDTGGKVERAETDIKGDGGKEGPPAKIIYNYDTVTPREQGMPGRIVKNLYGIKQRKSGVVT